MKRFLYRVLMGSLAMTLLFVVALYLAVEELNGWSTEYYAPRVPVVIDFPRGTPLVFLASELERGDVIDSAQRFRFWVKYFSDFSKFQAGQYRFEEAATPAEIAQRIQGGDVYEPVVLQLTIPEGFTSNKIADRLHDLGVAERSQVLQLMQDKAFLSENRINAPSAEGYLYPATYNFTTMPNGREALTKMINTFWEKLPKDYEEKVKTKGLSLNEALTFASLIELETRLEEEKSKVSEVIWNRLNKKVALAIDASIIYGIKNFDGNLRWKHLKDKTNPYNTRVHRGLPPTPIGSPSLSSLEAVLTPTDEGYFYYVLDLKDGSRHHFSKTLKEHNRHVQELVREKKRRKSGK